MFVGLYVDLYRRASVRVVPAGLLLDHEVQWVAKQADRSPCRIDGMLLRALARFDDEGIDIPCPRRVVHVPRGAGDPTGGIEETSGVETSSTTSARRNSEGEGAVVETGKRDGAPAQPSLLPDDYSRSRRSS